VDDTESELYYKGSEAMLFNAKALSLPTAWQLGSLELEPFFLSTNVERFCDWLIDTTTGDLTFRIFEGDFGQAQLFPARKVDYNYNSQIANRPLTLELHGISLERIAIEEDIRTLRMQAARRIRHLHGEARREYIQKIGGALHGPLPWPDRLTASDIKKRDLSSMPKLPQQSAR